MAPKANQMKLNSIHGYTTTAEMAPKTNQMNLIWIHILNTITELPPKAYQTIILESIKLNWIRWSQEHTSTAEMAPKSNEINVLDAIKLENMNPNWIREHATTVEMAPKSNQIIVLETIWICTSAELASRPKKHITNPTIEMALKSYIRILPEYFLIHYSATTKRRNMKMINNTRSLTLSRFLFMTNLPTMSGDHEHKETFDHSWITTRHNLWHNTHLSIKKYQNMSKLELTLNHSLHKQHTNYLRNRTRSFTYSLLYFMFNLSGHHMEISDHDGTLTRHSRWHNTQPSQFGRSDQRPQHANTQSNVNQHYLDASLMSRKRRNEDTTTVHKKTMINSICIIIIF